VRELTDIMGYISRKFKTFKGKIMTTEMITTADKPKDFPYIKTIHQSINRKKRSIGS